MAFRLLPLPDMQAARKRQEGFTLIELMVVVAIIGVLAAIAVPQFAGRQGKAYDTRIMSDARNAAMAEEAYFDDFTAYYTGTCTGMPGARVSAQTTCVAALMGTGFIVTTTSPFATKTCVWNSTAAPNLSCS